MSNVEVDQEIFEHIKALELLDKESYYILKDIIRYNGMHFSNILEKLTDISNRLESLEAKINDTRLRLGFHVGSSGGDSMEDDT